MADVIVAGVGMTNFVKPGTGACYNVLATSAIHDALADSTLDYSDVEQAYAGYVYADTTAGQRAIYDVGLTGIPVFNVNNACATGSSALFLARQAIKAGVADCALVVGFEEMDPGALDMTFPHKTSPVDPFLTSIDQRFDPGTAPMAVRLFAAAGYDYQQRTGAPDEVFARVRAKASLHAVHNERAIFRRPIEVQEVLDSPSLFLNVTRLQACPPTCGAAAAILVSDSFAKRKGLNASVRIRAQAMTTDTESTFSTDATRVVGYDMAKAAANAVYAEAGVSPSDVDVVELHDCFTTNEVLSYEALGLCAEGEASQFVLDGDNTYGGKVVTNPSGGLLSKGHPLGATGLAQCAELVWQLRNQAEQRQVHGARLALQHNLGIGGACVVTLYEKM